MLIQNVIKVLFITIPVAAQLNFNSAKQGNFVAIYNNSYTVNDTAKKYKLKKNKILIAPESKWNGDSKMIDTIHNLQNGDRKMTDTIVEPRRR
jgi:hypothetical protein